LKTIFLQPPDTSEGRVLRDMAGRFGIRVSQDTRTFLPPLEFAYAAAVLEKRGQSCRIIDAPALGLDVAGVLEETTKEKPELIVANTTPISLKNDLAICNAIKERLSETLVCLTGAFVSILPEIALKESKVDIIIRNEIEYTVPDLLKALKDKRLKDVKGITYKENDAILKTPDRPLIKNLDELPFPAFHLLPMDRYCHDWFSEKDKPFTTMLTSRGCSYGCIYCPYPVGYGDRWRGRSAQNVLSEISLLVDKFQIRSIVFRDQVFTFDMKRTEELCRGIIEKGIHIKWRCETRVDRLSKSLMTVMKEAGCEGIHMGVESGNPQVLARIGKPGVDVDRTKKIFADAESLGIETGAFFIIGLPGETKRSIWESYELAMELNPDIVSVAAITPYPGTELYKIAEEKGWILTKDWTNYTGFDVTMRTDELSEEDIRQAIWYFNLSVRNRSKKVENEIFSQKGFRKAFLSPVKAAKWVLRTARNRFTDPREEFRQWALEQDSQ
jgi:anaerobic magnesium-protoporphyrin IX monomethyl ester cyclase